MSRILNVTFDLVSMEDVHSKICQWKETGSSCFIMIANPHSVMLCERKEAMRLAANVATLVLPDGVGIILAARILGYCHKGRVTGPDLMLFLCDRGRMGGFRHFFLGGGEGVADRLASKLVGRFPGMVVAGTFCPPFRPATAEEDVELRVRLEEARPDILWVGLGAPKQEAWIYQNLPHLSIPAVIGVGAAFDFHSGNVPWAPRWIRRCGMEWAYRLAVEPQRMLPRNLDSFRFLARVIWQRVTSGFFGRRPSN